jgi:hypothetical protein
MYVLTEVLPPQIKSSFMSISCEVMGIHVIVCVCVCVCVFGVDFFTVWLDEQVREDMNITTPATFVTKQVPWYVELCCVSY